jgi:hypothetical protein
MNDIFNKSPEQSQEAFKIESEVAFQRFANANKIKSETDIDAYLITKQVFTAGFISGAQLILSKLVEQAKEKEKEKNDKSK